LNPDLISKSLLVDKFKLPGLAASLLMKLSGVSDMNKIYRSMPPLTGIPLIEAAFAALNIKMDVSSDYSGKIPAQGAFVTVSNHPFGLLDGIAIIKLIGEIRPDYRVTANFLLSHLEPVKEYFIEVNPFEGKGQQHMGASQRSLAHLKNDGVLGLFPAGEVATYYNGSGKITDKEWNMKAIRLIYRAGVPVLPVYFHGTNSNLFHFLGKINPALRTLRLPAEFIGKRNSTIRIRVGDMIPASEIAAFADFQSLTPFLREKVFSLEKSV
jgi:putative hemolysin